MLTSVKKFSAFINNQNPNLIISDFLKPPLPSKNNLYLVVEYYSFVH